MVSVTAQPGYRVRMDWGPDGALAVTGRASVAVVVDVLSFTTTLTVAVEAGFEVWPRPWPDAGDATFAAQHGAELAVARSQATAGRISLSPASIPPVGSGAARRLVLPSPNGASLAATLAERGVGVVGASLRNAAAVAAWVSATGPARVAVVAAGERWPGGGLRPAVEDLWGAGAVVAALRDAGWEHVSPEAQAAAGAFHDVGDRVGTLLMGCVSGRELVERGWAADVRIAAEVDASTVVPVLGDDGCFRPARAA